jgi:hypothetical protein
VIGKYLRSWAPANLNCFSVVLVKLSTHVGLLLYLKDMVFTGHRLHLVRSLYSSWSCKWWLEHTLQLVVVAHANFGGVTSAIHLIAYRGIANLCFRPHGALAQTLAHTNNPALIVRAPAINPLEPIEMPPPRQPIVSGDLLHGEGLFDISHPKLEIACRSIFTPSGWVRRWLTPEEFLWVFDIPVLLTPQLLDDRQSRSLLLRSLSPLVVASIFCSMWAVVGGGGRMGHVWGMKSRLVRIYTWLKWERRGRLRIPTLLEWR